MTDLFTEHDDQWTYSALSQMAKNAGGPEEFVDQLLDDGYEYGYEDGFLDGCVMILASAAISGAICIGAKLFHDRRNLKKNLRKT